jgi:hypothetical protein
VIGGRSGDKGWAAAMRLFNGLQLTAQWFLSMRSLAGHDSSAGVGRPHKGFR